MRKLTPFVLVLLTTGAIGAQVDPFASPIQPTIDPADVNFSSQADPIDPELIARTGSRTAMSKEQLETALARTGTRALPPIVPFGPPCTIPACAGTDENEPCGSSTNNGCVADFCSPASFIDASAGGSFCGTTFADADVRDLDYFEVDTVTGGVIDITLNPEFPANLLLIESLGGPANCDGLLLLDVVDGSSCTPISITRATTAGTTYYVVVTTGDANGPIFNGVPCGANNAYQLDISILSADCLGACAGDLEVEPCGNADNDGCNAATPAAGTFEPFPASGTVCGRVRTFLDPGTMAQTRDTDWYDISSLVAGAGSFDLTIDFQSEFPGTAFIIQDTAGLADCGTTGGLLLAGGEVFSGGCTPANEVAILNGGGTYYLFVSSGDELGAIFDGIGDCVGPADDYTVSLSVAPSACPTLCAVPAAGAAEGEPCPASPSDPDNFNGGCNSMVNPLAFSDVLPGDVIQGVTYADVGTRDTDWYRFDVAFTGAPIQFEFDVTSNVPVAAFLLANQTNPGSLDPVTCDLGTINVLAAANVPGNCTTTTVNATLNPSSTIGFSTYVIFISPADAAGNPIFSGFPCVCDYGYQLDIGNIGGAACMFPSGTCEADCVDGDIIFDLDAPVPYDDIEIVIEDLDGTVVGTINTGPVPVGPLAVPFSPPGDGVYNVTLTVTCPGGATDEAVCTASVFEYIPGSDIIIDGDPDGCIDSAQALADALNAAGRTVTIVDNGFVLIDGYDCLTSADNVWVTMGSFPNNFAMTAAEGAALSAGLIAGDFNLYVEGGDIWGFDAPTALFDVDGVEGLELDGTVILDGDDLFVAMNPEAGTLVDTSGFSPSVPYNQDNLNPAFFGGNEFTDQLVVSSGTDQPGGSIIEPVWSNADVGAPYVVTLAKDPGTDFGKVLSSSFEFGGFGDNQNTLMQRYIGFFGSSTGAPEFRRGDCNADGSFNIADAIFALGILFPGGGTPPTPLCVDSCDANDDGNLNIADAIAQLGVLFPSTSPPPTLPAPGSSTCGPDPTMDALTCDTNTNGC